MHAWVKGSYDSWNQAIPNKDVVRVAAAYGFSVLYVHMYMYMYITCSTLTECLYTNGILIGCLLAFYSSCYNSSLPHQNKVITQDHAIVCQLLCISNSLYCKLLYMYTLYYSRLITVDCLVSVSENDEHIHVLF